MNELPDSDERIAAWRLSTLPFVTARRLRVLLTHALPSTIVERLRDGVGEWDPVTSKLLTFRPSNGAGRSLAELWSDALRASVPAFESTLDALRQCDVRVLGMPGYPDCLALDPAAPAVLYSRGDPNALAGRRVAIIGTRNATEHGRGAARRFGSELSEAGVDVVSGLARGIDAAAHRGVLDSGGVGRPVAVVASGLDVVYPPEHDRLWERVGDRGFLCTESPPGTTPEPFRFPLRNRIIAAMSEIVLVIESRLEGGSLITVREALQRGVTVMAVPGATSTRASQGTNMLIRDGALVAIDTDDVLAVLGLDNRRATGRFDPRVPPAGIDARILDLFDAEPLSLDDVAARARDSLGVSFGATAVSLGHLETSGWLICTGGWFERAHV
jgi:DNA processing protein